MKRERILIRSVNWLGDAIMSMPAVNRLREARPDAHLTILAPEKLADIWQPPVADEVLTFTGDESVWQIARRIRAGRFDIALVMPFSFRSALESCIAGIPRRVGYAHRGRSFLLTEAVRKVPDIVEVQKRSPSQVRQIVQSGTPATRIPVPRASHHLHRYLHLAAALGADPTPRMPRLELTDAELKTAAHRFGLERTNSEAPLFGMNPGAEYGRAKRWPEERFVAAAVEVEAQVGCHWALFGGAADAPMTRRIAAAIQAEADARRHAAGMPIEKVVWDLGGATSLRELCAVLKLCALVVTNDTGPMHVAAAVGTPVVAPFGSTSPELTGPGLPGEDRNRLLVSDAACAPCFLRDCPIDLRCMNGISVQRVTRTILQVYTG
jgi:heptosyltransferase-2